MTEPYRPELQQDEPPACQSCGLCCCCPSPNVFGVGLTRADLELLPERVRLRVLDNTEQDDALELPTKQLNGMNACEYLNGTPGSSVRCSIYGHHPKVCTEFEPGGLQCLDARKGWGVFENKTATP